MRAKIKAITFESKVIALILALMNQEKLLDVIFHKF